MKIIEKIKDLVDVAKYRRRCNTMENKYYTLQREYNEKIAAFADIILKIMENDECILSSIKSISIKQDNLNKRLVEVENAKRSKKVKSTNM